MPNARNESVGSPHGGGEQGERLEGSLTDGGSLPGVHAEDRSFGAAREAEHEPGRVSPPGEVNGSMSAGGHTAGVLDLDDDLAGQTLNAEQPGFGTAPPR